MERDQSHVRFLIVNATSNERDTTMVVTFAILKTPELEDQLDVCMELSRLFSFKVLMHTDIRSTSTMWIITFTEIEK